MNECSDSYHLRSAKIEDALALLAAAKRAAYVFPAKHGWVSFVVAQTESTKLVDANTGLLLHYMYAPAHHIDVRLYHEAVQVGRLYASFDRRQRVFDRDAFVEYRLVDSDMAEQLEDYLEKPEPSYFVATALDLPRYAWFAYGYESDAKTVDAKRVEIALSAPRA